MTLRKQSLPAGWCPGNQGQIADFLSGFAAGGPFRAVVAPHAGWFYSGKIAAGAISRLDAETDAVAIIGGHLRGGPPLFAMEDAVETAAGVMPMDVGLRAAALERIPGAEDLGADNTVEVLAPMARFFFPAASLLWMRLPDDPASFEAGRALAESAKALGRRLSVIASADLTHYGSAYGFAPKGTGPEALLWVREVNDRRFIEAVESDDPVATLETARAEKSSCSAGAVIGAMGFARALGLGPARLLEYGSSADAQGGSAREAFVGYAAMAFGDG